MQRKAVVCLAVLALLASGCTIQKRTLMTGWHVERVSQPDATFHDEAPMAANGGGPPESTWRPEVLQPPPASIRSAPIQRRTPSVIQVLPVHAPQKFHWSQRKPTLLTTDGHGTAIQLDRDAELTLTLIGAALLMVGYTPFSIIGFLVVFLASIVGAPLVHALIWGERMNWAKSRLLRIALSLVLSGLVLTGVVHLLTNVLGLVF